MASPRDFAASIATCRFSFSFFWPINSLSSCGRSFNSNDESSSTGAADTRRSRFGVRLGLLLAAAIDSDSRTKCETAQSLMRTESKSCRQDSLSYLFIICHSERSAVVIPILKPLLIRSLNLFHSEPKTVVVPSFKPLSFQAQKLLSFRAKRGTCFSPVSCTPPTTADSSRQDRAVRNDNVFWLYRILPSLSDRPECAILRGLDFTLRGFLWQSTLKF